MTPTTADLGLLARCRFPAPGTSVVAAVSGGADSTAMLWLAVQAGCDVTVVHVDHGLRPESARDAEHVAALARTLGVSFRCERVDVGSGPNLEARARDARRVALGPSAMTGHTADDQAETVLLQLLRGAGTSGAAGMRPGPAKPILALRRRETRAVCEAQGITPLDDPTNVDPSFRRNRIRHEVLPMLDAVAERDAAEVLARAAALLGDDDRFLDELALEIDPTDAPALAAAPVVLARRAVRRWLTITYPPDLATVERVLAVARHEVKATDVGAGRRVRRSAGRLILEP